MLKILFVFAIGFILVQVLPIEYFEGKLNQVECIVHMTIDGQAECVEWETCQDI